MYRSKFARITVAFAVVALLCAVEASAFGPAPQGSPAAAVASAPPGPLPLPPPDQVLPPPGLLCRLLNPVVDVCDTSVRTLTRIVAIPFCGLDRILDRCFPSCRPAGMRVPKPSRSVPAGACPPERPRKCPLL